MKFPFEQVESRLKEFSQRQYYYSRIERCQNIRIANDDIGDPFDFAVKNGQWKKFSAGQKWPDIDSYYWLQAQVCTPDDFPKAPLLLLMRLSKDLTLHTPEGMVYVDGKMRHGIDRMHDVVRLSESAVANQKYQIAVRVYSGSPMIDLRPASVQPAQLEECAVASLNQAAYDFYHQARTMHQAIATMPDDSYIRGQLLGLLVEAFNRIDYCYPRSDEFYASITKSLRLLKSELKKIDVPPLPETVTGVGHSHIDVAWLWPLSRTREKSAHTFSTVLDLMERYPDYKFVQSQAQLYEYIKQDEPGLYKKIKQKIKNGQWEAEGGMWVEADCNLTSGESLVRQFLYGQRFFEDELGVKCKTLWLPDVFGYSWALPQILKGAEIENFVTSKISWNQYNQMPFDLFRWRGMDGSEVLTSFLTAPCHQWFYTYNGLMEPGEIKGTWQNFKPKSLHNEVLLSYGYGDGGGGPTEEMLQTARCLKDMPAFPKTRLGRVDEYLERLEPTRSQAPVWNGELYLEYHRGTYTSQAQNKRFNRQSELLMQQTELIASLAALAGTKYPRQRIRKVWEKILLNQFHDIIPGSSIHEVYEESTEDYQWIREEAESIIAESCAKLTKPTGKQKCYSIFNTLGWMRFEPLLLAGIEADSILDSDGDVIETQTIERVDGEKQLLADWDFEPFSAVTIQENKTTSESGTDECESSFRITKKLIENEVLRVNLNAYGEITSIYDKEAHREVLADGEKGNVFQAFEDKPLQHDAWDIDLFYQDKMISTGEKAEIEIIDNGPLRATLKIRKTILNSAIEQNISLYRDSNRIDFDTKVDWFNKDTLLKAAFPVAINASAATYDIQFGNVQRPTHFNTSWDWARFETCAHKWVDLSEGYYGVSLINDCKYGHDIHDHTIRLTLIKCAGFPDPLADVGTHRFAYSLVPHMGDWRDACIPQMAYEFNSAPLVLEGSWNHPLLPEDQPFIEVNSANIIVESVKFAEKEDALIVRLFECYNKRGPATLTFNQPLTKASRCNLLERQEQEIDREGYSVMLNIKPYEIVTLKIEF